MEFVTIEVPDMNDSVSRIVLCGQQYNIRFTYNDTSDYWKFSLYDAMMQPVILGIKIVPRFPLNAFYGVSKIPKGVFGAMTNLQKIGRDDFGNGKAKFIFVPA